uniref:Uncharacterized protein n=1 Tax=Panagrolaimus sp. PS1159 TaxID=55785 RepID=A0AC35ESK8_9BILA
MSLKYENLNSPKSVKQFSSPEFSKDAETVSTNSSSSKDQLPTSKLVTKNDTHFYSQFNDDKYLKEQKSLPFVCGKGGVALPLKLELAELLKDKERIKVMCFTWNINNRVCFFFYLNHSMYICSQ